MILQFKHNEKLVDVYVTRKKIKNIYIKLDQDNKIVVSAPKISTKFFIQKFVSEHFDKFAVLQETNDERHYINFDNKTFYLFGEIVHYEILNKISRDNEIIEYLLFNNKKYKLGKKTIKEVIFNIYKKYLYLYLVIAQSKYEKIMNVETHQILIRIKQSAWASNYVKDKKIFYSTKLAAYSHSTINYVIVHELAHAEHSNHSKEFWKKVSEYEQNYSEIKKKLKSFIYF
ncbi:MAG: DUF45 domain-containing protein [Mycoplasmataceae bacterium]|nr:DUF45 domain-containing protein [Mycoplasmataceae bacterium]